ncbi:MAG: tRNA (N(6)-L-threonylcarbamoyladenosine(37)-C(2))-methylthiotransferase MtaB [Bacteriovoracaceae bacterium]|nr:tRNA (N(6)-L-threonylcarbamoyladenosine(37)-C(2))-methylthiotransferase MtaB [Bacteriovoracaceae bacterium]
MNNTIDQCPQAKKVAFYTLGCRLNAAETSTMVNDFVSRGYQVVEFGTPADVIYLNTCTVTGSADSACRNIIRRANKSSPDGIVVVAGCYAQMDADAISKIEGVDFVLGNWQKFDVFSYLDQFHKDSEKAETPIVNVDKSDKFIGASSVLTGDRTRAFLKVQDGCNYMCSYCIIPFARGGLRSMQKMDALTAGAKLLSEGFKEIVLTGVNIGEYDDDGNRLSDLLFDMLKLPGLSRLRLSSIEPNTVTDEILGLFQSNTNFMDHFHLPLQSGDNGVLKGMRRRYTTSDFISVVSRIKSALPNATIGTDVIVGTPGESDEQFENTYKLIESLPITHLHVFPYSPRKETAAAAMPNQVHGTIKKKRAKKLIELGQQKLADFCQEMVGTETTVLFEKDDKNGLPEGHTSNFIKVKLMREVAGLQNQIRKVKVYKYIDNTLFATLL